MSSLDWDMAASAAAHSQATENWLITTLVLPTDSIILIPNHDQLQTAV